MFISVLSSFVSISEPIFSKLGPYKSYLLNSAPHFLHNFSILKSSTMHPPKTCLHQDHLHQHQYNHK